MTAKRFREEMTPEQTERAWRLDRRNNLKCPLKFEATAREQAEFDAWADEHINVKKCGPSTRLAYGRWQVTFMYNGTTTGANVWVKCLLCGEERYFDPDCCMPIRFTPKTTTGSTHEYR